MEFIRSRKLLNALCILTVAFFALSACKQQINRRAGSTQNSVDSPATLGFEFFANATSAIKPIATFPVTTSTGEKPQSKLWTHENQSWCVLADSSGTWLRQLDRIAMVWVKKLKLSNSTSALADTKAVGDLAHVLLFSGTVSSIVTLEYLHNDLGGGAYMVWPVRPNETKFALDDGVETATLDVDSTGRMWIASDGSETINVRYSDYPYNDWTAAPLTIAEGVSHDDISAIVAMPDQTIGVMWSNQRTQRFGFRIHEDHDPVDLWSKDEVPASQSALNIGHGMADDHIHLAVHSNGTLYAAIKTGYDRSGLPRIGMLIRQASGNWDNLHTVAFSGTRPVVAISEAINLLRVFYTSSESGGKILCRESRLDAIKFSDAKTILGGRLYNNASVARAPSDQEMLVIAGKRGFAGSVMVSDILSYNVVARLASAFARLAE